jgi:hypothetical protein
VGPVPVRVDLLKDVTEGDYSQKYMFTGCSECNTANSILNPETQPFTERFIQFTENFSDSDRISLIKKTYHSHNHLHFNIPLVCFKFPVSQYTCDG